MYLHYASAAEAEARLRVALKQGALPQNRTSGGCPVSVSLLSPCDVVQSAFGASALRGSKAEIGGRRLRTNSLEIASSIACDKKPRDARAQLQSGASIAEFPEGHVAAAIGLGQQFLVKVLTHN